MIAPIVITPTPDEIEACKQQFIEDRVFMIAMEPWFGILLTKLGIYATGMEIPTAAVDYQNMYLHCISEKRAQDTICFQEGTAQRRHLIMRHELLHVVLHHIDIPQSYDAKVCNLAMDAQVNRILERQGAVDWSLMKAGVQPRRIGNVFTHFDISVLDDTGREVHIPVKFDNYDNADWPEIYEEILKQAPEIIKQIYRIKIPNFGTGTPGDGSRHGLAKELGEALDKAGLLKDILESGDQDDSKKEELKTRIDAAVLQVTETLMENAKSRGSVPSEIIAHIENLKKSVIPWRSKLRRVLTKEIAKIDFTWKGNPRKRHLGGDGRPSFFPIVEGETLGDVWLCLDTSGSLSDDELVIGISEFRGLRKTFPFGMYFVSVDAELHEIFHYDRSENPDWSKICKEGIQGRGGTIFDPVFIAVDEHVRKTKKKPSALVYFTDGYAPMPEEETIKKIKKANYPVYWVVSASGVEEDSHFTFGTVIRMVDTVI